MKKLFKTPQECITAYNEKVKADGYGPGFRHNEQQQQCAACWLWKYCDGRCNLFRSRSSYGRAQE